MSEDAQTVAPGTSTFNVHGLDDRAGLRDTAAMKLLKLGSVLLLAAALISAAGCNTVEGAGQDLEALGKNTSRAARENNPYREPETPANANPYR